MAGLDARLNRLEAQSPTPRCPTCRDWSPIRIEYDPPETAEWHQNWDGTIDEQPPDVCPGCGYQPLTIVITYVENWRGVMR